MHNASLKTKVQNFDYEGFIKWRIVDKVWARRQRHKINNLDFSIISNNCIASGVYHKLCLKYTTPTVGLFFFQEDYIRFLENLKYYIEQPINFKETSKFAKGNSLRATTHYPLGVLPNDVEIHFLHYKSEQEASEKWNRRVKRINFSNLFLMFTDGEDFKREFLDRYEKLPYANKIFLSSKPMGNYSSVVFVREDESKPWVRDSVRNRKYEKYIDLIKWLNGELDFRKT